MGRYFNPPLKIKKVGRELQGDDYESLQAELQPGELLFSLAEVFGRPQQPFSALYIETQEEHTENRIGHVQEYYEILGYWAVPEDEFR